MRIWLAIVAFFRILFARPLPPALLAPPFAATLPKLAPPPEPPKPVLSSVEGSAAPSADEAKKLEENGARAMLAMLQSEGRLIDFLMEPIDGFDDAQIGAAVRAIHQGCRKALADHAPLEPVLAGKEESKVTVPSGFDPAAIRLTGNVVGAPPFSGTLKHHGWRAKTIKVPARTGNGVVAPAEVEL